MQFRGARAPCVIMHEKALNELAWAWGAVGFAAGCPRCVCRATDLRCAPARGWSLAAGV